MADEITIKQPAIESAWLYIQKKTIISVNIYLYPLRHKQPKFMHNRILIENFLIFKVWTVNCSAFFCQQYIFFSSFCLKNDTVLYR